MTIPREWDSSAYHRLSDPQYGWGLKMLAKLQSLNLKGNEHILDAGCGSGRVTASLLQAFPQCTVTAVDASANMVAEASGSLQPFGQRVKVEKLDLLELKSSNCFDVIFSTAVFHWIKDHDSLFHNLFHALRPGGFLLAQCGGGANLERVRKRTQKLMELPQFSSYFKNWERLWEYPAPELTAERLKKAGFTNINTGLEAAPTPMPDEQTYRNFGATVILHPHLKRLPQEMHDDFLGILSRQAAADDPPFLLDYWRLNIYGRKP